MRRLLSAIIAFSLVCTSFIVPSFAADREPVLIKDVILDYSMVDALDSYLLDAKLVDLTGKIPFVDMESAFWGIFDKMVSISGYGRFETYKDLLAACSAVNSYFNNPNPSIWDLDDIVDRAIVAECLNGLYKYTEWKVTSHYQYGYVISEVNTGAILCNSRGEFPYYLPTTTDSDTGEEVADPALGGKWVRMDKVAGVKNVVSEAVLDDLVVALVTAGETVRYSEVEGKWKGIQSKTRFENGIPFVYCDSKSRQYVQQLDPDEFAVNNNQNIYTEDDDDGIFDGGETMEHQFIDIDSNTIWFPDGTFLHINNNFYDESTKSYYVDASSSYDIDNNYYYTYNYHYEYHIDYTSITYIGQTAEYDEVYEYYYQLPDGRSSADLTADELLALNTQIDVLPYIRSADDTSIRALYHFDGDTRDSSYWSHLGEFKWNKGASITYMDAGAFNGALYLDENEHDFTITLPSGLGTGDFTIQFRYYQSHTLTPQTDSYFMIGATNLLQFDGASVKDASGNTLSAISVGNWQEISLVRKSGTITVFLNGVPVGNFASYASFGKDITFHFGADQQTYKYFDELRVINKAVYSTSGYTPTSVPHDTNLSLVLPDSVLPVADEYWSISSSGTNILAQYGLDWLSEFDSSGNPYIYEYTGAPVYNVTYWKTMLANDSANIQFPVFGWQSSITPLSADGGLSLTSRPYSVSGYSVPLFSGKMGTSSTDVRPTYGLITSLGYSGNLLSFRGKTYTLSVVTDTGSVTSLTFSIPSTITKFTPVSVDGDGFRIATYMAKNSSSNTYTYLAIQPLAFDVPTPRFIYMELVEGESTDLSAEFVSSVVAMDKDDLNTPSLAVRTDLNITGYQLGGVRPSLPTKGLVWGLVEAGRITSLQIYNGQAWEEVDGRIWTGSRWIPYYAYDVLLLKDMYDIVESDPSLNPIYTETGFWRWLQGAWGEMMSKLDLIVAALGGSSGDDLDVNYPGGADDPATDPDETWTIITLATEVTNGVWRIVTGVVSVAFDGFASLADGISSIDGFFSVYDPDSSTTIFAVELEEG